MRRRIEVRRQLRDVLPQLLELAVHRYYISSLSDTDTRLTLSPGRCGLTGHHERLAISWRLARCSVGPRLEAITPPSRATTPGGPDVRAASSTNNVSSREIRERRVVMTARARGPERSLFRPGAPRMIGGPGGRATDCEAFARSAASRAIRIELRSFSSKEIEGSAYWRITRRRSASPRPPSTRTCASSTAIEPSSPEARRPSVSADRPHGLCRSVARHPVRAYRQAVPLRGAPPR